MISKCKKDLFLFIRIALGAAFIFHGLSKLMNIGGTSEFLGLSATLVFIVGLVEFLAGIGVFFKKTVVASSISIIVIMLAAIIMMKYKMGYLGGYELDIAYIAMSVSLLRSSCDIEDSKNEKEESSSE